MEAIIEVKIYNIKKANNSKFGFFTLFLKYHHNYDYTHVFTRKWNDFIFVKIVSWLAFNCFRRLYIHCYCKNVTRINNHIRYADKTNITLFWKNTCIFGTGSNVFRGLFFDITPCWILSSTGRGVRLQSTECPVLPMTPEGRGVVITPMHVVKALRHQGS